MATEPTLVTKFVIPAKSGDIDLVSFFPNKRMVVVDTMFFSLVEIRPRYSAPDLACGIYQTERGVDIDDTLIRSFGLRDEVDVDRICAILSHLGGEGNALLDIPKGHHKVDLVLGYINVSGLRLVLFVRRERMYSANINILARAVNRWGDDMPMILVVA